MEIDETDMYLPKLTAKKKKKTKSGKKKKKPSSLFTKKALLILVLLSIFLSLLTLFFWSSTGSPFGFAITSGEQQAEAGEGAILDSAAGQVYFTVKEKPVTEEGQVVFNVVKKGD